MKYVKEGLLLFGVVQLFVGGPVFQVFLACATVYVLLFALELVRDAFHAKGVSNKMKLDLHDLNDRVIESDSVILSLQTQIDGITKSQAAVKSMAEESKKLISQANLGLGFRAIKRDAWLVSVKVREVYRDINAIVVEPFDVEDWAATDGQIVDVGGAELTIKSVVPSREMIRFVEQVDTVNVGDEVAF